MAVPFKPGARNRSGSTPSDTKGGRKVVNPIKRAVGGKRKRLGNSSGSMTSTRRFTGKGK